SRIMGKSKQVGNHNSDRHKNISKKWKTKRRTKDLDEIHSDMKPETAAKLLHQEVDYDEVFCGYEVFEGALQNKTPQKT
ncbi:hypothetical protein CRUP_027167, partial [Coryphaenoides rupestris]